MMGSSVTNVVVTSPGAACDQECWVHVSLVSRSTVSQTLRLTLACKYWMGQTCQTTTGINRKYRQNTISQGNKQYWMGLTSQQNGCVRLPIHSGINTPFRRIKFNFSTKIYLVSCLYLVMGCIYQLWLAMTQV